MTKYKALIIGSGNIGAFYDNPLSPNVLSHAHAFKNHVDFELIGFVDKDETKSNKAAKIWGCKSFQTIDDAFNHSKIDVAVVSAPDHIHYEIIKKLTELPLKIIFAEKPLAKTLAEAEEIIALSKNKNIPILINYSRRFVAEIEEIAKKIHNNFYGKFLSGNGCYGKGILHNGSHMIDLLRFLIGEIKSLELIGKMNDFYEDDPSVSAILKFSNEQFFTITALDCKKFTIFEADLFFEKARLRILDSGLVIEEYFTKENEVFKGYKNLNLQTTIKTSLHHSLSSAVENISKFLKASQPLKCNINDGYKALEIALKMSELPERE